MRLLTRSHYILWLAAAVIASVGFMGYRILAAGGGGTAAQTSNNSRQSTANSSGLIAWYPLDGDAKDYSGNNHNGSITGTVTPVNGKFGKAYSFSPTDGVSRITVSGMPASYLSGLTYSLWLNINLFGHNGEGRTLLSQNGGGGYLNVNSEGGKIRLETCGGGCGAIYTSNVPTDNGSWVFVVTTYLPSSTTGQIYLNGKLNVSSAGMGNQYPVSSTLVLGSSDIYDSYTTSYIDDVRVYNRILSASEITALYAGTPSQNCDQTCKVRLKLDDNTGTSAVDSSGLGNTGTLSGTTTWTTGNFASAVALDGSTGAIAVPNLALTSGTVDAWINPTTISGDQRIFSQSSGSSTQAGSIALNQSSGESGSLWVWDGSTWQRLSANGSVTAGSWNHIVVTNSGGTATAYLNGTQQLSAAAAFNFSGVPSTIGGKFLGTTGGTFNGTVDDFRVYSRILAPEEIADKYRQGS